MTIAQILKQTPILSPLSDDELEGLAKFAHRRELNEGEFLFWEGDQPQWFYIVEEGKVKVVKQAASGKEFILSLFTPGEIVGEVAVFQGKPYPASAQAIGQTTILVISSQDLLDFLGKNPSVSLKIMAVLGERLRQAHARLRDLAGERVEQRIASLLLMLASKLGAELPFTRQEIADMAGTTTETAIRVLSRLGKGHIVVSRRGRITILDEDRLRLLSQGPPSVTK
jgi:CRP/FNR family transcriptional regulator, nitrogen oxide reductase regulator